MDRGAWQPAVHRVAKRQTQLKRLSMHAQYRNRFTDTKNRFEVAKGSRIGNGRIGSLGLTDENYYI